MKGVKARNNMHQTPFFSILTAAYNSCPTLGQTIESIKVQCFQNFEHIIIDGGSKDNTVALLKQSEAAYNLKWISEPDNGIAAALNKGLRISKGLYIIVIQADDALLTPHILESVYPLLKNQRIDILSFPVILQHPVKGKMVRKPIRSLWWNHFKFILPHQGCFVNRRVFERIGGFREEFKINLDYDFFYRALVQKMSIKFGEFPVTLMGGCGIGSDRRNLIKRLEEERLVQKLNEKNPFWKAAQLFFSWFYTPYKTARFSTKNV
jgi:glycosyltransferase involved in cell wall biosynthesis